MEKIHKQIRSSAGCKARSTTQPIEPGLPTGHPRERITGPHGITLRLNRSIQAEGVFGNMKHNYGFRRFLRRGKANVFTETILYAFAYNINKLHQKRLKKNHPLATVTYHLPKGA